MKIEPLNELRIERNRDRDFPSSRRRRAISWILLFFTLSALAYVTGAAGWCISLVMWFGNSSINYDVRRGDVRFQPKEKEADRPAGAPAKGGVQ